jgi:hypothetical protein
VTAGRGYTLILKARLAINREKKDVSLVMSNGQQKPRTVGFAIIRLDKYFADEVVLAEKGDSLILGA